MYSDDSYVFTVTRRNTASQDIHGNIGGIEPPAIVDSGSSCNVIDRELREDPKKSFLTTKRVYAYGSATPLTVTSGFFYTSVGLGTNVLIQSLLFLRSMDKPC
ncbi:hypothetical protein DPMN_072813 [Dreissena polymorpha]|uniref:Uncharacterized protein n=1 Tax=Dreissena polymorpha TaxID=45954 RepID=A0A9D4BXY1_DREPO|nr:hypothetical protein DPMN_072813 [Dreissena polymorpha]